MNLNKSHVKALTSQSTLGYLIYVHINLESLIHITKRHNFLKWLLLVISRYVSIYLYTRDMYLSREMEQILIDFDFNLFFYCWGEFLKYSARVYTFLFISKIHPNTEIRDQNLSPSKVITLLCKSVRQGIVYDSA